MSQTTYPPNITGVDSGYPADGTLGSSGYTVLYGNYLAPDTQVNFEYTISQSANTGPHNLTVTTAFGTSNAVTFTVGDPTPAISSVSPSTWDAGTTTSFTVYGAGFGDQPKPGDQWLGDHFVRDHRRLEYAGNGPCDGGRQRSG